MFERLDSIVDRYEEIERALTQPDLSANELRRLSKEHADLEEIVISFRRYRELGDQLAGAKEMLNENDDEIRTMAKVEIAEIEQELEGLTESLVLLMLPKDPNDARNVILEVRAGTGGDEAALFCSDLFRMYHRYAERQGWSNEILSCTESSSTCSRFAS